jgi:hypothetical protein
MTLTLWCNIRIVEFNLILKYQLRWHWLYDAISASLNMIWYWDITFYETYFTTCMTIVLHVVCYLYRDNVHGRQIYNLFVRALETGQTASLTRDFLSRCESITIFFFIFADNVRILCFSFMRKLSNLTTKWENHWTFWMGIYGGVRVRLVSIALLSTQDLRYQYTSDTSSIIQ